MANSLNIDLHGKTVVFKVGGSYGVKEEYADMKFRVYGGFGASPQLSGTKVSGTWEDGESCLMHAYGIRAVVLDEHDEAWYDAREEEYRAKH